MRIFLIGFMGAGKSYVGRRLAELRQMDFIDLDDYIVEQAGKSIPEIFAQEGEMSFRLWEVKALRDLGNRDQLVIACGGGTPCFFDNLDWMNAHGLTVYLDVALPILQKRLQNEMAKRPLLADKTPDQLHDYLQSKLAERRATYEAARIIYRLEKEDADIALNLNEKLRLVGG